MKAAIARARDYVERQRLQPDLNRAARCTVAFLVPMVAGHFWGLPVEASFAAIAAQNVALVDVRGSYPLRLSLLVAMGIVLAGATWLGCATSGQPGLALGGVVLLMAVSGAWRHLNAEYGPSLGTASALLFLMTLAHPMGEQFAGRYFLAALAGGAFGVLVQSALWPFRAQHPLRRAVADSWLALSDLLEAMTPDATLDLRAREHRLAERQSQLRTALDHASAVLAAAAARHQRPYVQQLEALNLAAARFSTRFMAFNVSFETLMERPDFAELAPSFDPLFASFKNSARTVALTIVSRQPSHLAASEVRLQRLGTLLQALQDRVLVQTASSPDGVQLSFILRQITGFLPDITGALRATVERAGEHSAFSLELFDLQTWTLRPLASSLNLQWRPDPALLRFVARSTVLQLIGVAAFKLLELERGYWLPLTMLVVLQPEYGATRMRAGQRLIGTLAGSVAASGLLWLALPYPVIMGAMALTMAGFAFWLKRNYAIAVFFITLFVVLITEISMHVTLAFTLERLAATAIGGILALLAALLFWPVWERTRLPGLLAAALRRNRDYVQLIGERLSSGGAYDAPVIAAKRAVELADAQVFSSLQRMSADPKGQQVQVAEAAALANGNQRLARAVTVIALHLQPGEPMKSPRLTPAVALAVKALDQLAAATESGRPTPEVWAGLRAELDHLSLRPEPADEPSANRALIHAQLARCATELSAMLIAAESQAAPFPEVAPAAGLPSAMA